MNLKSSRDRSTPQVVLYQFDLSDPMNPQGLLMAYAEAHVKPVVSDFDLFTIGSKGYSYDRLPDDQVELVRFSLEMSENILAEDSPSSWTSRWLECLRASQVDLPKVPSIGICHPSLQALIKETIKATQRTGAVRHSAECFNYVNAQDLDMDFLIVWDGFKSKGYSNPWAYYDEDQLRDFLHDRIAEGFSMPLNPVWIVRDLGWYDILKALRDNPETKENLLAWFPPGSGLMEKMEELHHTYPEGHVQRTGQRKEGRSLSAFGDLTNMERADLGHHMLMSEMWKKARSKLSIVSTLRRCTIGTQPGTQPTTVTSPKNAVA